MTATVAMIGVTHPHSDMYLETLEEVDEVTAIHLVDENPTALAETAGRVRKVANTYSDVGAVLARPDITHVLIAIPNVDTPALLCRAIEAGKNVFTEKTAARTATEFEPVLAALSANQSSFGIAYLNRGTPAMNQIRTMVQGGAIGKLMSVEVRMVTTQVQFRDPSHWLFKKDKVGGGILAWLGCHWLDMVRYVTGDDYAQVSAQLATLSGEAITVEDTAAVSFRLSSGAVGTMHAGYMLAVGKMGYRGGGYDIALNLRGTEGSILFHRDSVDHPLVLESVASGWRAAQRRTFEFVAPPSRGYGGVAGLDFFRSYLATPPGKASPADAVDALRVLELLDGIYESAETGRSVDIQRRVIDRALMTHETPRS